MTGECTDGNELRDRVDGSDVEPGDGVRQDQPGCAQCYAERMARRLKAMGQRNYADGFAVRTHEHMLEHPLAWKRPLRIFVNSMSDLFHRDVPAEFIQRVFGVRTREGGTHAETAGGRPQGEDDTKAARGRPQGGCEEEAARRWRGHARRPDGGCDRRGSREPAAQPPGPLVGIA